MPGRSYPRLAAAAAAGLLAGTTGAVGSASAGCPAGARTDVHTWSTRRDFTAGTGDGVATLPAPGLGLVVGEPAGTVTYHDPYLNTDRAYEYGTWTSPVHRLGFGATEVVSWWNAQTPAGTWLKVELNATMEDGAGTGWLDMGHWASGDADIRRASVSPDAPPYGRVDTDTFTVAAGHRVHAYRLRVTLYRAAGTRATPWVWRLGAVASTVPDRTEVPPSRPGPASRAGIELPVPAYSQLIHTGEYPQWDGGGEAWCSPTSTEMVVEYWGRHPSPEQFADIDPRYADPSVDVAARGTYDYAYQGTGNWPFNTAYAASYGLDAEVVRLRSLDDVEHLVAAGFPVVTSQAFDADEIPGVDYRVNGHLWVVVGFTSSGDVVVNDPASGSDAQVRHVFARRAFENVWLRTTWTRADGSTGHGSGGIAYLVRPHLAALPPVADPADPTW